MSKTTAPLLSFDARGALANTLVYSSWRGIAYARRHVVPANPKTSSQQFQRGAFSTLREMWKIAPSDLMAPWDTFATGRPFTGMNAFIGNNRLAITTDSDMNEFIGSPGARGGLPADSMSAASTANAGEISVDFTTPTPPAGWTLTQSVVAALPDQAPNLAFVGPWSVAAITASPWDHTITGLTSSQVYQLAGWLVWTKPDGRTAYSVSITDQATPT